MEAINWTAIEATDVWKNEIKPWLDLVYMDGLENGCPSLPDSDNATLEQYHFWRGWCAAVKSIRDMPHEMIEIERQIKAQEQKDAIIRRKQERRAASRY